MATIAKPLLITFNGMTMNLVNFRNDLIQYQNTSGAAIDAAIMSFGQPSPNAAGTRVRTFSLSRPRRDANGLSLKPLRLSVRMEIPADASVAEREMGTDDLTALLALQTAVGLDFLAGDILA